MENIEKSLKNTDKTKFGYKKLWAILASSLILLTSNPAIGDQNNLNNTPKTISKNINQNPHWWKETIEEESSYEKIFKDGIKRVAVWLKGLPKCEQKIDYYRDSWKLAWTKITSESVKWLELPETFDILPRKIDEAISSMTICLGDRRFEITPWVGKIKNIKITDTEMIIETNVWIDIVYDKENKLPELALKLRRTDPKAETKSGFKWSTVREKKTLN